MSFQKNNLDLWINNQFGSEPLFLLVDGAQVEHDRISNLEHTYGHCIYLLKGTYEEDAYQYGPILFNLNELNQDQVKNQMQLMQSKDSMILIKSYLDIKNLKNKLLENLYIELEDGGVGILRYYDPRVINRFSLIFTNEQKNQFMDGLESISYLLNHLIYEIKSDA